MSGVSGNSGSPAVGEATQEYAAFKIEQRGIDLIPDAERQMKPSGLFWLWSGAVFNVEYLFYGTLIMIFGLTVSQAILAILVGNLSYLLLGWARNEGPQGRSRPGEAVGTWAGYVAPVTLSYWTLHRSDTGSRHDADPALSGNRPGDR